MKFKWKMTKENAVICILAGMLCCMVVWPTKEEKQTVNTSLELEKVTDNKTLLNLYIENQEERLKNILVLVDGVGKVEVMIRASASKSYIVEKDVTTTSSSVSETDSQGGTRQSTDTQKSEASLYTKDSSGNDVPWVIKEMEPEIEGVLVAAEGGSEEQVVREITQAVQVLFDIPVHKIKVVKLKAK